jgi:N-acetylglucosamine kinase-like BadF-type ATPase
MVLLGVDGGATKTEALVVAGTRVAGAARCGPSNHQAVGWDAACHEIADLVHEVLRQADLCLDDLDQVVLGLAGMDFPEDFSTMTERLGPLLGRVPFSVVNDAEIALDAGTDKGYGIVAICGTGGNVFGRAPDGRKRQVGGLGYEYGDWGSGIDVARATLHAAFRSAELRGPATVLEPLVLAALGRSHYQELSAAMYRHEIPEAAFLVLAPLCFRAAADGDAVAQDILQQQGRAVGGSVVGCARLLQLEQQPIDVILAGSLWLGQAPQMKQGFWSAVQPTLPLADIRVTALRPVAGAILAAARQAGQSDKELRAILARDARFSGVE